MINDNPNSKCRPAVVAAIAAGLLVFISGLTHRGLAALLLTPTSNSPIDPNALEGFPMQIGDWTGQDIPLDETILRKIGADAYINRRYSHRNAGESVSLFVAASGVTTGTLVGHPPEICNVVAGSTLTDDQSMELPLDDGTMLPCKILQFSRGGALDPEKKTVLYYYMADGQFCGDRSVLRARVRRGSNIVNCVAQVQIAASSVETATADAATRLVCAFAADSASLITMLFVDLEKDRNSSQSQESLEGK